MSITGHLRVSLLGSFRLLRDEVEVSPKDWHTRQARQLFKLLLTERGHLVPSSKLIALLWPEHVEHPHKALRSAISALRDVLEPDREPWQPSSFVPRGREGYTLLFPPTCTLWLDVSAFEQLLNATRESTNSPEARSHLESALRLYAGDYLAEDGDAPWVLAERMRLRERYFAGVLRLLKWQGECALYEEAIALGQRAIGLDACHESLYRFIMQYQALTGNTTAALQTFERCRQVLNESMGTDPSPQTLELHMALLNGRFPEHTPPSLSVIPATSGKLIEVSPVAPRQDFPFVGRRAEFHWLVQQLLLMHTPGQDNLARVAAIVGEAGTGKSALLRLFLHHAQDRGVLTLSATCRILEQGMPFAPLLSLLKGWLDQASDDHLAALPTMTLSWLALLLPELGARLPQPVQIPVSQTELVYSMLVNGLMDLFLALSTKQPFVLALDDLQWVDASTIQVLDRLAHLEPSRPRHGQAHPFLLLVAYRPEEVGDNPDLSTLLHSLQRDSCLHLLTLNNFTPEEVAAYLQARPGATRFSPEALYQVTQGNALFLTEAVRAEVGPGNASGRDRLASALSHAHAIRAFVFGRLERLPRRAVDLLEMASVIARPFPPMLLGAPLSPEDYQALDILLQRGFLVEAHAANGQGPQLALSHELMGQTIASNCSVLRISYLHYQVAQHMERAYAAQPGSHAAEIARHYCAAGAGHELQALRYTLHAAEHARQTFSYQQALTHYAAALHLLLQHFEGPQREEWLGKIYRGQSLVYEALLDWKGIQEKYQSLSTWATTQQDLILAHTSIQRMIVARSLMGYCAEAADMGQRFIHLLQIESERSPSLPERTREGLRLQVDLTRRLAQILALQDPEEAPQPAYVHSLAPFPPFCSALSPGILDWEQAGDILGPAQAAFTLSTYGWALLLQGLSADAERCLLAALNAAEATGQVTWGILASLHLSRVYFFQGQRARGTQEFERCLERCQQVPEATWLPIWPLLNQAYYLLSRDHLDEAERLFLLLQKRLAGLDLPSYRYSAQIGLGLLSLARRQVERARTLLCELLTQKRSMYIETYILAEIGLAKIDMQQGAYAEAFQRLQAMLELSGKRSLLELYAASACSLAHLSLHMQQAQSQGVAQLLQDVHQRVSAIGSNHLARECDALLARLS